MRFGVENSSPGPVPGQGRGAEKRVGSNPTSCKFPRIQPATQYYRLLILNPVLSEDGRVVKARDSSSRRAICVGSNPTPRIWASLRPLQVRPPQKGTANQISFKLC